MNAAIYARYSSDNQREESIEAQIRAIQEYANRNGIHIVKTYIDEARSATTDDRPQFLQMIKDSGTDLFGAIIIHKFDRFSRSRFDSAFYKKALKKNGVKLISVLEQLDDSPESVILESVLEGMAEYYSKNLAREVFKGLKENAYKCKFNGGTPALGYDVDNDKNYIINEAEARIIRLIFSMYSDGFGYTKIIDRCNELGYKTKKGIPFGKNSLHEILKNEKYIGVYTYNKTYGKIDGKRNYHQKKPADQIIRVEDGIPPIIDKILFERVQEKMERNKKTGASNKSKITYLLSGIIVCGKCNGSYVGNRKYTGKKNEYYHVYECSTRKRIKTCDAKCVSKDDIETQVLQELISNILSEEGVNKLSEKIYNYSKEKLLEANSSLAVFEKELDNISTEIENIVDAVAKGLFHESFKSKMDKLETRNAELLALISEARYQSASSSFPIDKIKEYILKDSDILEKSPQKQKEILQEYIRRVEVDGDECTIYFKLDSKAINKKISTKSINDKVDTVGAGDGT